MVARRSEETPDAVAGDVGAVGCVQADARLERVRAFVKVQDGCSFSCAFCVIPFVRGESRSRRAADVVREVRRRIEQGHKEIVLTGINLGCYRDREAGYDAPAPDPRARRASRAGAPAALVDRGQPRERGAGGRAARDAVGRAPSARPAPVGRRRRAAGDGPALRRGHVPAPGRAARRLQRHDGRDRRLSRARTSAAFERTLDLVRRAGISSVHVFPYSPRPGTKTAAADTGPARGEARPRRAAARALARVASLERWRSKVGSEDVVLIDRPGRGLRRRLLAVARARRGRASSCVPAPARSPRRGYSLPDDCLFCELVRAGDHVSCRRRLRRGPRHQPEGRDAPARHPRAPRRHLPRGRRVSAGGGEADARVRRRDRARVVGSRTTA